MCTPCSSCGASTRLHSGELPFASTQSYSSARRVPNRPSSGTAPRVPFLTDSIPAMTMSVTTRDRPEVDRARPVAYIAIHDRAARARIVSVLEHAGWAVIPQPTGFHVIQAISGVIEGDHTWLQPSLIVVDARARGCAGTTIAAGLRELGITIPIVLVAAPGESLPISPDRALYIVDSASADAAVARFVMGAVATTPQAPS